MASVVPNPKIVNTANMSKNTVQKAVALTSGLKALTSNNVKKEESKIEEDFIDEEMNRSVSPD